MNVVLSVFILIAVVLFVVGLFNPKASLFWYKRKSTRWLSTVIYLIVIISLSSISASLEVKEDTTEINNPESKKVTYKVVSEKESELYLKAEVEINLSDKVDEEAIHQIAEKYQKKYISKYQKVFIWFYLGDYRDCFATAHCEPDMKIKFLPMSDLKREDSLPNFYTFPKANQWTPAKPENKLIEFIEYLKVNDWKKMETICRSGYDSNDLKTIFSSYTDLKRFKIDKINETKYKSDIQITLCYCLDKDMTKQFEVTLLRINKDNNPDINAPWLVDPIFKMR